MVMKNSRRS